MATRWNKLNENTKRFFKSEKKWLLLGIILYLAGFFFLFLTFEDIVFKGIEHILMLGCSAGLFFIAAVKPVFHYIVQTRYKNWFPSGRDFYGDWKEQCIKQQEKLFLFIISKNILSLLLVFMLGSYSWVSTVVIVLLLIAFVEYLTWEVFIIRFMKTRLNALMECMARINQENVEAAIRSEKMKVDLISNVSHDLKTPLTSIVAYIDLMKKEELSDVMTDYVEVLYSKAEKLKEMIESLFSLAKTSSGNIELKMEAVNMNRLIEQIYADMEDHIRESGLEFVSELTVLDTEIITDSSYIYRICQNLIENALKYSAEHTRVFLKTSVMEQEDTQIVRFEITNTANYRMNFAKEQIVERFSRGDEARSSEGNGLGLAIVSTYTVALGGMFDVSIDCDQFKAILDFEKKGLVLEEMDNTSQNEVDDSMSKLSDV